MKPTKKDDPPKPIRLTVEGYEAENIADRVAMMLAERFANGIDKRVEELTLDHVKARLAEVTTDAVQGEVDKIIASGWTETDSYGNPRGGAYGGTTRIDKALADALDDALHGPKDYHGRRRSGAGVLQPIIDDAKKKFRELVDQTMTAKLQATLREALGLKS